MLQSTLRSTVLYSILPYGVFLIGTDLLWGIGLPFPIGPVLARRWTSADNHFRAVLGISTIDHRSQYTYSTSSSNSLYKPQPRYGQRLRDSNYIIQTRSTEYIITTCRVRAAARGGWSRPSARTGRNGHAPADRRFMIMRLLSVYPVRTSTYDSVRVVCNMSRHVPDS